MCERFILTVYRESERNIFFFATTPLSQVLNSESERKENSSKPDNKLKFDCDSVRRWNWLCASVQFNSNQQYFIDFKYIYWWKCNDTAARIVVAIHTTEYKIITILPKTTTKINKNRKEILFTRGKKVNEKNTNKKRGTQNGIFCNMFVLSS